MKYQKIGSMAALLLASSVVVQAQTITAWTFDNDGIQPQPYNSPAPSTGSGIATVLGMLNTYNGTNSVPGADIASAAGSSTPSLPDAWRVRGNTSNPQPNAGNGWSTQALIGTQGAEFSASTAGFNNITVSFDIDTTAQAERNLAVEYTLDDTVGTPTWLNATITSAGNIGTLANNSSSSLTISGNYVQLGSGWNNGISASISGAGNDANFAVEIVNASTGTDCLNISGTAYNNSSGNWRYDNVVISAAPEPTTLALAGLGGLAALVAVRRRK
jgi:PEP-CTERM motif